MKCFKCGTELDEGTKFCIMCGTPQGFSEETIAAAASGDQNAIAELYNQTYNSVYQSVRMMIKDEDTALDVVQDAYIRGFQHLDQLEEPNYFRAWMKRIAVNTAKNYLKKKQPILFSEMEGAEEDDSPELQFVDERQENLPEVAVDRQETTRLINEILGELSEEQRFVVTMYYYEEMNAREIAEELGVSENTVRSRLNYGKKKIEAKVLELEKRDGIRLHSLAPIPFLLWLFKSETVSAAVQPSSAILQSVQSAVQVIAGGAQGAAISTGAAAGTETGVSAAGVSAVGAEASAVGASAVGTGASAVGTGAAAAAKIAAGTAVKGISTKVIAGIVAASVAVGGGGTAYAVKQHNEAKAEQAAQIQAEKDKAEKEADKTAKKDGEETETPNGDSEKNTDETEEAPKTAEEGLWAFGETKAIATGNTYDGYLVGGSSEYQGQVSYSPQFDNSAVPEGWLDYQVADLDGDGEEELAAITVHQVQNESWTEPWNAVGVEVYEWDSKTGEAKLASEIQTTDIFGEEGGIPLSHIDSVLDCFFCGENSQYIGLMSQYTVAPIADGADFNFAAVSYQDGELQSVMQPLRLAGSSFADSLENFSKMAQELAKVEISIGTEELMKLIETQGAIEPYAENYKCIAKIVSEGSWEYDQELHKWLESAYVKENVEPRKVSEIRCEGGSKSQPDADSKEAEAVDKEVLKTVLQKYAAAVEENNSDSRAVYHEYSFVYIDNDNIPELVGGGRDTAHGTDILYISADGSVQKVNMSMGQFCYAEKTGYIDNDWYRQETNGHHVYLLKDGVVQDLGGGSAFNRGYHGTDWKSEEFKKNAVYEWEGTEVSREVYEKKLAEAFPYSREECKTVKGQ